MKIYIMLSLGLTSYNAKRREYKATLSKYYERQFRSVTFFYSEYLPTVLKYVHYSEQYVNGEFVMMLPEMFRSCGEKGGKT